jgi:hypothetical protein
VWRRGGGGLREGVWRRGRHEREWYESRDGVGRVSGEGWHDGGRGGHDGDRGRSRGGATEAGRRGSETRARSRTGKVRERHRAVGSGSGFFCSPLAVQVGRSGGSDSHTELSPLAALSLFLQGAKPVSTAKWVLISR